MAQTPQQFFEKNVKWFAIAFFVLFCFKVVQGCNRNMGMRISEKKAVYTIDSLTKKADILERKLEICETKSQMKDDFISLSKTQKEKELEIKLKEAEQKIQINNNFTIPKDTINRK
jgi:hypothetical protein